MLAFGQVVTVCVLTPLEVNNQAIGNVEMHSLSSGRSCRFWVEIYDYQSTFNRLDSVSCHNLCYVYKIVCAGLRATMLLLLIHVRFL